MKTTYILLALLLFFSCSGNRAKPEENSTTGMAQEVHVPAFQSIIDSADLNGSLLIFDLKEGKFYSNNFKWAKKGYLPASTFKITNSMIGLETGVLKNDSTVFKWNGEKRMLKNWEQDLTLHDAFHYSCVPCYQEVARKIGPGDMNAFLAKLEYGNMKVDSSSIDLFWLEGESRISQFEQIDFLRRFYQSELPLSKRTESIMKRMMRIEDKGAYKLSGKTGWSIRNGNNNGWFVGYIESASGVHFFATNVEPKESFDMSKFPMIRSNITLQAFKHMNILL